MATAITGEMVKSAIGAEVMNVFNGTEWYSVWYKEAITSPKYPNFFVNQLSMSSTEERKNHYFLEYLMEVRYRYASDPTSNSNIQQILEHVGTMMLTEMRTITIGDYPYRLTGAYYEKEDGILHFFFNVRVPAMVELPTETTMETLDYTGNLKEQGG